MDFVSQCEELARTNFKLPSLRTAQKEVLNSLDSHKYILATLPTGSGKTLLYALPALVFAQENPVLVLSPLISLMRDQARRMHEARVPCVIFTSEQSEVERKQAWQMVKSGNVRLIFASPERLKLPSFLNVFSKIQLSMAVVDEAHCVVSWGHQFRPEYSEIGKILEKLNPRRILALTATASQNSRLDIIKKVFPENAKVFEYISKPLSPHIFVKSIRVFSQQEQWGELVAILKQTESEKTIVYFQTRKLCEEFARKLREQKIHSIVYHAGLSKQERVASEQYAHVSSQKTVICATTAFGMGVDISGIRLVVVYGFPGNIEEFFQMLGRAGRGGEKSCGILLWTGSDPIKRDYQLKSTFPTPSAFVDQCKQFHHLFPKSYSEKSFVETSALLSFLKTTKKDIKWNHLDSVFSGLRICNALEDIIENESYYAIKLNDSLTVLSLLNELPNEMTKRKKILNSLLMIAQNGWSLVSGAQTVVSLKVLLDASELTADDVEQVFSHYANKKCLQFDRIGPERAKQGVILKNGFAYLQKELTKYVACRQHFFSSLLELNKLARAATCRLSSSFDFFVPGLKLSRFCGQCDLCAKNNHIGFDVE